MSDDQIEPLDENIAKAKKQQYLKDGKTLIALDEDPGLHWPKGVKMAPIPREQLKQGPKSQKKLDKSQQQKKKR